MSTWLQYKSKKIDITPSFPCRLTGMTLDQQSNGIYSKLETNVMVFQSESDVVFLVSIDTLFVSKELKLSISRNINQYFGETQECDIIIIASHTHYSPSLEEKRIKLGAKDEKYLDFLLVKIDDLLKDLKDQNFQTVHLSIAEGKTEKLTCSRRRKARFIRDYFNAIITLEPNPRGYKNEEFKVLNILDVQTDSLVGVIWSFPCHPTNFPDRTLITSEFPGEIRESIRRKNEDEFGVIYLPGMAGDVRAYPPVRRSINKTIRSLLNLSFRLSDYRFVSIAEYVNWSQKVVNSFWKVNKSHVEVTMNSSELKTSIFKSSVSDLGLTVEGVSDVIYRKISFGEQFAIYTISAEPVSYYWEMFRSNSKEKFVIYTGYSDEVFGYLPTNSQKKEGGYESIGFFDGFLVTGEFIDDIEQEIEYGLNKLTE